AWLQLGGSVMYIMYMTVPSEGTGTAAPARYGTVAEARKHLKELLDASETGRSALVRRGDRRAAVVDADRLRRTLSSLRPSRAETVHEAGGWSVFLPGLPVAADGTDLKE